MGGVGGFFFWGGGGGRGLKESVCFLVPFKNSLGFLNCSQN